MPPRPHPLVLIALAVACFVVAFLIAPRRAIPSEREAAVRAAAARAAHPAAAGTARRGVARAAAPRAARRPAPRGALATAPRAAGVPSPPRATWRWPLHGRVVGVFHLTPYAPFARGQRRGIDIAASPGTAVRAACPGRVTFAGRLPRNGLAVTVRCGALVATYLRLGQLAVRRGAEVAVGERVGLLATAGRLRLGARRAGDRRAYVDPLSLLRDAVPTAPPTLGPAPRARRPRHAPLPPARPWPRPRPAPASQSAPAASRHLPWPAYPAIALIAAALPVGSLVHHRRRRRATTAAAPAHEGP